MTTKSNPWLFLSLSFNTIYDTPCIDAKFSCSCNPLSFSKSASYPGPPSFTYSESDQRSLLCCLLTSDTTLPIFCPLSLFLVEAPMDFYLDRNTVTVVTSIPVDILTPGYPHDIRSLSSRSLSPHDHVLFSSISLIISLSPSLSHLAPPSVAAVVHVHTSLRAVLQSKYFVDFSFGFKGVNNNLLRLIAATCTSSVVLCLRAPYVITFILGSGHRRSADKKKRHQHFGSRKEQYESIQYIKDHWFTLLSLPSLSLAANYETSTYVVAGFLLSVLSKGRQETRCPVSTNSFVHSSLIVFLPSR